MTAPARTRTRLDYPRVCGGECGRALRPRRSAPVPGTAEHRAHGLCRACHWHRYDNRTGQPRGRRTVDVAEDFAELVAARLVNSREAAADMLGMTLDALDRALYRAGADLSVLPRRRPR